MAPTPPTLGSAPAQPWRSSITVVARPRNGPHTPNARKRPGAALALLDYRRRAAPKWPPHPQRSEAPRHSRGAPRLPSSRGPEMAPKPPTLGSAPAQPWRPSITVVARPRNGPQTPNARKHPGAAVAPLDYPLAMARAI